MLWSYCIGFRNQTQLKSSGQTGFYENSWALMVTKVVIAPATVIEIGTIWKPQILLICPMMGPSKTGPRPETPFTKLISEPLHWPHLFFWAIELHMGPEKRKRAKCSIGKEKFVKWRCYLPRGYQIRGHTLQQQRGRGKSALRWTSWLNLSLIGPRDPL